MRLFFVIIILVFLNSISSLSQWIPQNSSTNQRLLTLFFLDENNGWAGGNEGCIMKTTDGGNNWIYYSIGTKYTVHSVHFVDSLTGWAVIYTFSPPIGGYIIATTDGGANWYYQYYTSNITLHHIQFIDENIGWAVGSNGIFLRTINGGSVWQENFISDEWAWGMYFINQNMGWCSDGTSGYIKKTIDGGLTWNYFNTNSYSRVFGIHFINSSIGWIVGGYGSILRTNDGGINWVSQSSGINSDLRDVKFVNENMGWAVGLGGVVLHTTNGGNNWLRQNSNTSYDLFGVSMVSSQIGWIAGTNGTILYTENGGGSPLPVELTSFTGESCFDKITLNWVTATELNNSGFEIQRKSDSDDWFTVGFVKGNGTTSEIKQYSFIDNVENKSPKKYYYRLKQIDFNGVYEYSVEIEIDVNVPSEFRLYQNYPNPFNPVTNIRFQLSERSEMSLKIFDILGNEVETLVDDVRDAGFYNIYFDANSLASGIYFYTLHTAKYSKTNKMVLLK